jgi:hypothetical protein
MRRCAGAWLLVCRAWRPHDGGDEYRAGTAGLAHRHSRISPPVFPSPGSAAPIG